MKTPTQKKLLSSLMAVLLVAIICPASAAIYVKIPGIPGDVTVKGYDDGNWFEVKSGSYGTRASLDEAGQNLPGHHSVGTGNLKQLGLALHTGPESAVLLQAAMGGASIGDVEIHLVDLEQDKEGVPFAYTFGIVKLGNAFVHSFTTKSFAGERPWYQVHLLYRSIEMTTRYEVPTQKGEEIHESVSFWDLASNAGEYHERVLPPEENPNLNPYSYEAWRQVAFSPEELENPEISGPYADWDKDGLNTLIEYKLGKDPRDPSDSGADIVLSKSVTPSSFMELSFVQRPDESDPNVLLVVEGSELLAEWNSGPDTIEVVSRTPIDEEFEQVTVRSALPIAELPSFFFRFRAEELLNQ